MKKIMTFLISIAMVSVATASPTWTTVSGKQLINKVGSRYAKHAKYIQSKGVSNKKIKYKVLDPNTIIVSTRGNKIKMENVGNNIIELNGVAVKFSHKISPQRLTKNFSKALRADALKVSFLESLFVSKANAGTIEVEVALLLVGLAAAVFGGFKWGEANEKKKHAAVPAAQYQTPAAVTQATPATTGTYTPPANPKAGTPYVPAVPGSVAN